MPVSFLTTLQRESYGRYAASPTPDELARFFHKNDVYFQELNQNYIRDETLAAANNILVSAQNQIPFAQSLGGGEIASADGIRFVVPIRTVHAGYNPKYWGREKGVTWYNLISNQFSGLNAMTVPGTLRDSLNNYGEINKIARKKSICN